MLYAGSYPITPANIGLDALLDAVAKAREDGYAITEGEYFAGDMSLAAPIVDAVRTQLAPQLIKTARAICLAGLSQRAGGFH